MHNKIAIVAVNSEATEHGVNRLPYFGEVQEIEAINLTMADEPNAKASQKGKVLVSVLGQRIMLRYEHYVPSHHLNVMSCSNMGQRGMSTAIVQGKFSFRYLKRLSCYLLYASG